MKSASERSRACRERKRKDGLVLKQIWVHPAEWDRIVKLISQLRKQEKNHERQIL